MGRLQRPDKRSVRLASLEGRLRVASESHFDGKPTRPPSGLRLFLLMLGGTALLYLAMGFLVVPFRYLTAATYVVSVLFIALPILALFAGANFKWTWKSALFAIVAGVAAQAIGRIAADRIPNPVAAGAVFAISQTGLIAWCLGLGAFLASLLKDKNLLLPLAIFLALFDVWLVFVPEGPVGQIARGSQATLSKVAYVVPRPATIATGGRAAPQAYVGPADFVFLAMFFVALYRFEMNPRRTFKAVLPVLVLYLLTVLALGWVHIGPISLRAMPALLPIGAVVLAMNWREFKLNQEEKLSTLLIAVLGIAIVSWRMALHWNDSEPRPAPSRSVFGQGPQGPRGSILQGLPDQRRWPPPLGPKGTPDPR